MVTLNINGTNYNFPELDDEDWGEIATVAVQALATLTASLRNPSTPMSTVGNIRLGNGDVIGWRKANNDGNISVYTDGNDDLIWTDGNTSITLTAAAAGNVNGPTNGADDQAVARFDGVTGQILDNSLAFLSDVGLLTVPDVSTNTVNVNAVTVNTQLLVGIDDVGKSLVPVGSIIPHYDFGSAGPGGSAITFDTNHWKYCNGSNTNVTTNVTTVAVTLPDLSGRYLVGFGTDGDGTIDSAAWATTAVGNAAHQVDLSAVGASHTHTGPSHTHSVPSHNHTMFYEFSGVGATNRWGILLTQRITDASSLGTSTLREAHAAGGGLVDLDATYGSAATSVKRYDTGTKGSVSTGAEGTEATGPAGTAGSATQSIQPRSIRVRFIMRVK